MILEKLLLIIVFLFALLCLFGCGYKDQKHPHVNGYTPYCIDGVTYLVFPQSITVKLLADGKPEACK